MKTRFELTDVIFIDNNRTLEEDYQYYEENYREKGFILDKKTEDVYKVFDKQININEGDRVLLDGEFMIVNWKCLDLENETIIYSLELDK